MEKWAIYHKSISEGCGKAEALYRSIRSSIANGSIQQGERLPSTRELAKRIGLSRGVAINVYERLMVEGYAEATPGGYTTVCAVVVQPDLLRPLGASPRLTQMGIRMEASAHLLEAKRVDRLVSPTDGLDTIDLRPQRELHALFPHKAWQRSLRAVIRTDTGVLPELSLAIATHLKRWRGVQASPEHIVVTSGSQQALILLTSLFVEHSEHVLIESPGYVGIRAAVQSVGGVAELFPADNEQVLLHTLEHTTARFAIITPNRQFPTGRSMSATSRAALLTWAEERDAFIVEDDYDSDFGFGGHRYEPLQAADCSGRVLYIGSFSRTMGHNLRIGYMLLPKAILSSLRGIQQVNGLEFMPRIEQAALALFMQNGEYERHLRRVNREIRRKAEVFSQMLQEIAGHLFKWYAEDIGFHLFARWRQHPSMYTAWSYEASRLGLRWRDGEAYEDDQAACPSVVFGIAHISEQEWEKACLIMLRAWESIGSSSE